MRRVQKELCVAHFGNGWVKTRDGNWVALTRARFTADSNPVTNINAALDGDRFLLATGGDTKNDGIPLNQTLERSPPGIPALLPGERITDEVIAYLRELTSAGARLHGAADPSFRTVRVLIESGQA